MKKVLKCIGNKHDKNQDEKNAQNHYKNNIGIRMYFSFRIIARYVRG